MQIVLMGKSTGSVPKVSERILPNNYEGQMKSGKKNHLHVYEIKSIVAEFRIGTVRKCRIKINI